MKLYDKFFEPITDLDKKGFFADKLLTGKVTFTKKKADSKKNETCKLIHKSQLENDKDGKLSHFGEGQVEAECDCGKLNMTFSEKKFSVEGNNKSEMNLHGHKQPYNVGMKFELPFDKVENQMGNIFFKLNGIRLFTQDTYNHSEQIKVECTRGNFPKPTIEVMGLNHFKNFYIGKIVKFNTSLAPMFPLCEAMIGFKNANFQAYAKYAIENLQFLGKPTLGLYATRFCEKNKVKFEVGGEGSFDLKKKTATDPIEFNPAGFLAVKMTGDDHGFQMKYDVKNVLTTAFFVKPMKELKLTVSDCFNCLNLFKDQKSLGYRYGFGAEWEI